MSKQARDASGRFLRASSENVGTADLAAESTFVESVSKAHASVEILKGPSQGPSTKPTGVSISGAETASDAGTVSEMEIGGSEGDVGRKRPFASSFFASGYLDSDTETEGSVAAKVGTAMRGRGRAVKAASREAFLKPASPGDGELEQVLRGRTFRKGASKAQQGRDTSGSDSDVVQFARDAGTMNAQQLRAQAGEGIAAILEVASKSGNLKGEFVGRLKRASTVLREVVDTLAGRTEAEETRRLRAENGRLRLEVEAAKAEVKALRRGFAEAQTRTAEAIAAASSTVNNREVQQAPSVLQQMDMVEELRRSLTITVGEMMSARFEGLESRLLPAPVLRPPLRADAKREAERAAEAAAPTRPILAPGRARYATVAARPVAQAPRPIVQAPRPAVQAPRPAVQAPRPIVQAPRPAAQAPRPVVQAPRPVVQAPRPIVQAQRPFMASQTQGTRRPAPPAPAVAAPVAAQQGDWETVTRKRRRRRNRGRGRRTAVEASSAAPRAPVARPNKASRQPRVVAQKTPNTAAVVLSLQPDAVKKGVTYKTLIDEAQGKVDLEELGIDQLRFRTTATGARLLEIPGSEHDEKADRLAGKLREVLSDVANVSRPVKVTDLRITGLDDAATKEKVAVAVARAGGCEVHLIRPGDIRQAWNGSWSCLVACPIPAAKLVLEKGRLLIGWSSVGVMDMGARPMRCYRCMGLGHTRPQCPAAANRGDLCYRCGEEGHRSANCGKVAAHCAICAEVGRPAGHIMGGRSCVPPKTKGKVATTRTVAAPEAPRVASPAGVRTLANEEVAMSD